MDKCQHLIFGSYKLWFVWAFEGNMKHRGSKTKTSKQHILTLKVQFFYILHQHLVNKNIPIITFKQFWLTAVCPEGWPCVFHSSKMQGPEGSAPILNLHHCCIMSEPSMWNLKKKSLWNVQPVECWLAVYDSLPEQTLSIFGQNQ